MDDIYKKIGETLLHADAGAYLQSLGLKPVKTVDLYWGQPYNEEEECAYDLPAVFIEFAQAPAKSEGRGVSILRPLIRLHVEQLLIVGTKYNSYHMDKGLEYLQTVNAIDTIVSGIESERFAPLQLAGYAPPIERVRNPVTILEYTTQWQKCDKDKFKDYIQTDPDTAPKTINVGKQLKDELDKPVKEDENRYMIP